MAYHVKRSAQKRLTLLRGALAGEKSWVLSGSLCGWGDALMPEFDAVIFVTLPTEVRLERTRQREQQRFGGQLEEGGPMHRKHLEFMAWLARLPCPVLRVENSGSEAEVVEEVLARLSALS